MEAVLATFGGILLLLSIGGGVLMKSKFVQIDQHVPPGDRIRAGLIGASLIAAAAVIEIDAPNASIEGTFGIFAGLVAVYVLFLFWTRDR